MLEVLKRLDLNLLVVFDVLLDERSVTRAASRLSLSQPATSAALARLRASFDDKLLVRGNGEMLLTERASALRQPIKDALRTVAHALDAPETFHPEHYDGRFRIAILDVNVFNLGADIVNHLRVHAPLSSTDLIAFDRPKLYDWFKNDQIDAAIVVFNPDEGLYESQHLYDDELVFVGSTSHPARRKRAQSVSRLSAYPLIETSVVTSMMRPFFEQQEAMGIKWSTLLTTTYFSVVPALLQGNDCIGLMGRVAARRFQDMGQITILEVSEPMPNFHYKLVWHKRHTYAAHHRWMRAMIKSIAGTKC